MSETSSGGKLGIALVGVGGAVATTAIAGIEMIRKGIAGKEGLLFSEFSELAPCEDLVFGGWDVSDEELSVATASHGVLDDAQLTAVGSAFDALHPWPAAGNPNFCHNAKGSNLVSDAGLRAQVETLRDDLRRFREEQGLSGLVMVNLASTERAVNHSLPALADGDSFERALDNDDPSVGPAMLYAYAALREHVPYANFAPSSAADVPALRELARREGVPIAGKDGKTGQTMLKTALAPAFRSRGLHVDGWYSTNLLGNRDGYVLEDLDSRESKIETKGSVLEGILGYPVGDHLVSINYYPTRGDDKEAWDSIDFTGFLGRRMQLKVNLLASDSALAAPLVIELARLLDLARRRGESGVQEQLGFFFKAPMTPDGSPPEHALHQQEARLMEWLSEE